MRVTASILVSFIAVGIAMQVTPTTKSKFSKALGEAYPSESDHVDGNWRIGCDRNNHCSYYHDAAAATSIAASESVHPDEGSYPERSARSANATAIAVRVARFPKVNATSLAVALSMVSSLRSIFPMFGLPVNSMQIFDRWFTDTPQDDDRLTRRSQNVSLHANTQPLFGRHVAFAGDQCEECDLTECPVRRAPLVPFLISWR